MSLDISIKITDRQGTLYTIDAPTDMALNLMEVVRLYELVPEGTIGICGGMAMCASCQCYVQSSHLLPSRSSMGQPLGAAIALLKIHAQLTTIW
jgi:2Fe-2S ferredoxin